MMMKKRSTQQTVRDIRRAPRRHCSAEEKIRIVLEGLRGEDSIAELRRREGINSNVYYRWSKEFLGAGKDVYPVIRFVKRPPMRLNNYAPKPRL
jgi:transposase-like protein